MKIYSFNELTSTNDKASKLLQEGAKVPFAVVAHSQTKGRGHRAKVWDSKLGNLYISFVLDAGKDLVNNVPLPLKAASLLASWLEEEFSFRPTIKWPNDILVHGKKLAGILCETSSQGETPQSIIVGIGLNVTFAPELKDYKTTCLRDFSDKELSLITIKDSLTDYFARSWSCEEFNWFTHYRRYEMSLGSLWFSEKNPNHCYMYQGIDPLGAMRLKPCNKGKSELKITSAGHGLKYSYQKKSALDLPLFWADIGNSNLKLAFAKNILEPQFSVSVVPFDMDFKVRCAEVLEEYRVKTPDSLIAYPLHVSSVNKVGFEEFKAVAEETIFEVIQKDLSLNWLQEGEYPFSELGFDRKMLMEAWLDERRLSCKRDTSVGVIVGLGTATTIDVVHSTGKHLGGFIMPGLQMSLDAMEEKTDLLPKVSLEKAWPKLGQSTESAMRNGCLYSIIGSIEKLKKEMSTQYPGVPVEVVMAEGGAAFLKGCYEAKFFSHLVLQGLRSLF